MFVNLASFLTRRGSLGLFVGVWLFLPRALLAETSLSFSFDSVVAAAQALADQPFDETSMKLTGDWLTLNYDEYRALRFRSEHALFRDASPFEVHFFHPGGIFTQMSKVSVVEGNVAHNLKFDPAWFRYDFTRQAPAYPENFGFAGIRVHYPLNTKTYKDELIVFQGASYFKFLGRNQKYGLSARGLAIDSGMNKAEEFPFFREFWISRPEKSSQVLTIFALLDSPSITGAYSFEIHPAENSIVNIREVLFPRKTIDKVGIAPLSSMFFFGENKTLLADDFRPEVHDSDGLLLHTGSGEWVWRPLVNRQWLTNTSFVDRDPRGFGLIQRDREFSSYEDVEAFYHERPSYWIEPTNSWGGGRIELVELPTRSEINDNIVVFWVPEQPVVAGNRLEFSYRLTALLDDKKLVPSHVARTLQSRVGTVARAGLEGMVNNGRLFVVEFTGKELELLSANEPVEGMISNSSGRVENIVCHKNSFRNVWRLHFDFYPDGKNAADLRVYLKLKDKALTETWSYLWTPFDESARVL